MCTTPPESSLNRSYSPCRKRPCLLSPFPTTPMSSVAELFHQTPVGCFGKTYICPKPPSCSSLIPANFSPMIDNRPSKTTACVFSHQPHQPENHSHLTFGPNVEKGLHLPTVHTSPFTSSFLTRDKSAEIFNTDQFSSALPSLSILNNNVVETQPKSGIANLTLNEPALSTQPLVRHSSLNSKHQSRKTVRSRSVVSSSNNSAPQSPTPASPPIILPCTPMPDYARMMTPHLKVRRPFFHFILL
ncbi:unnamed protein product [Protopolystoma xenopodis]|uniref:Uncharacterized protein n=1 Tax=Protopolystoma xenopodis TaxID=117903 RepID=A0A3S5CJJ0_9PLAT|nr:unnamed protein product [Protopolystoma xenopodis]